jgi:hypothetical protein
MDLGKLGGRVISHCGSVWGSTSSSYLYIILTNDFAYIGETGNLPTARWGMHLSKTKSSFKEKLLRKHETLGLPPFDGEFLYVGLFCEDIDKENENMRKFARLALEDAIHQEFVLRQNSFWPPKELLSTSTKKSSARITFNFDIASFAKVAVAKMVSEYSRYISLVSRSGQPPEQYGFVSNIGDRANYAVSTCNTPLQPTINFQVVLGISSSMSAINCSYSRMKLY